jgi:hypothetical protein
MDRSNLALHDIKPLMQIPDNSLYLLIALILVGLVVLGVGGYFLRYFLKNRNKVNQEIIFLEKLKNIDLTQTKESAYLISAYGNLSAKTYNSKNLLIKLNDKLEQHKYQKNVPNINKETQKLYFEFLESIEAK